MTFKKCDVKRLRRGSNPQPLVPKTNALPLRHAVNTEWYQGCINSYIGPLRGLNPGPPAPEAGIIPLDQADGRIVTFWQIYKSRSVTLLLIIIKHFYLAARFGTLRSTKPLWPSASLHECTWWNETVVHTWVCSIHSTSLAKYTRTRGFG